MELSAGSGAKSSSQPTRLRVGEVELFLLLKAVKVEGVPPWGKSVAKVFFLELIPHLLGFEGDEIDDLAS